MSAGCCSEGDDVDAASERLQADVGTDGRAEGVHHVESRFAAIQERRLEAGAAARFEMGDAGRTAASTAGMKSLVKRARAEDGLEAIAETGVLEENLLLPMAVTTHMSRVRKLSTTAMPMKVSWSASRMKSIWAPGELPINDLQTPS
jgi:hypothetical protein